MFPIQNRSVAGEKDFCNNQEIFVIDVHFNHLKQAMYSKKYVISIGQYDLICSSIKFFHTED